MPKTHISALQDGDNITFHILYPTNDPPQEQRDKIQAIVKTTCERYDKEILYVKTEYDVTEEQYFKDIQKATENWKNALVITDKKVKKQNGKT